MTKQDAALRTNRLHCTIKVVLIMMNYGSFSLLIVYWPNVEIIPHRAIIYNTTGVLEVSWRLESNTNK